MMGFLYRPHRDHQNQRRTLILVVCLDDDQAENGGSTWVEDENGAESRQVCPGRILNSRIHDVRRQLLRSDPGLWHRTELWTGSRVSITAFTAGHWTKLTEPEKQKLKQLEFPIPESGSSTTTHHHDNTGNTQDSIGKRFRDELRRIVLNRTFGLLRSHLRDVEPVCVLIKLLRFWEKWKTWTKAVSFRMSLKELRILNHSVSWR